MDCPPRLKTLGLHTCIYFLILKFIFAFAIVSNHKLNCLTSTCYANNERHGKAIFRPTFSQTLTQGLHACPIIGAGRLTRLLSRGAFITCWIRGWCPTITCSSFSWIVYLALLPGQKVRESAKKKLKARATRPRQGKSQRLKCAIFQYGWRLPGGLALATEGLTKAR